MVRSASSLHPPTPIPSWPLQHDEIVTSFTVIERHKLLVTAGLDANIFMWDLGAKHKYRGRLKGFTRGIRQIVYSSDHDLLIAVGFEYSGLVWDVNTNGLLMK